MNRTTFDHLNTIFKHFFGILVKWEKRKWFWYEYKCELSIERMRKSVELHRSVIFSLTP
jgi:hypothetical protein